MRSYGMKPPEMDARATRAYLGNIIQESKYLTADLAVSATSASVPYVPRGMAANLGWIVIDAYTSQCEVRKITSKTLESVSWSGGLAYGHSAGDAVLFLDNPVLIPEYFGGVGDNSTDNSDAFTALAAELGDIGGGMVTAGPGTYLFGDTISWPSGITSIVGSGAATIFKYTATDGSNAFEFTEWDRADGAWLSIRDLTLEGAGAAATGTGAGIQIKNTLGATIDSCVIRRFGGGPGVYLRGAQQVTIQNSWIVDCDIGIHLRDANETGGHGYDLNTIGTKIDSCHIQGHVSHGVYIEDLTGSGGVYPLQTRITNCIIQGNGGAGVYAQKFSRLTIEDVYFETNQTDTASADIYLADGNFFTIRQTEHHAASPSTYVIIDNDANIGLIEHTNVQSFLWYQRGSYVITRHGNISGNSYKGITAGNYNLYEIPPVPVVASDGDTTPSVLGVRELQLSNSSGTTISDFDDGYRGQEILVWASTGNSTIDFTGTNLKGNGGADWAMSSYDSMRCLFVDPYWLCIPSG